MLFYILNLLADLFKLRLAQYNKPCYFGIVSL